VLVVTYNHARFIAQALESALGQRTSFGVEILVSEDCSTDGTREKVIGYQRKYPDRIRLLLSESNLRSNAVVARGIRAARGEYLALLDGDDYWISPDKLKSRRHSWIDSHDARAAFTMPAWSRKAARARRGTGLRTGIRRFPRSTTSGGAISSRRAR
jgi:glycosyltransferase involved in cell wall biosynthesis